MSTIEKKVPSIGQLLAVYFHCDDPAHHAQILLNSWAVILSNLDHSQNQHLTPANIQLISAFLLDFQAMSENQRVPLEKAMN